ncbi:MAG: hypothetical protein KC505_05090 [Myxococcales bacterium]|nr:hypothetical protein [Myxococcales bacterium]USN50997.1 MAG: hypothetical protein H6731_00860 [Myxococcales bacterium]
MFKIHNYVFLFIFSPLTIASYSSEDEHDWQILSNAINETVWGIEQSDKDYSPKNKENECPNSAYIFQTQEHKKETFYKTIDPYQEIIKEIKLIIKNSHHKYDSEVYSEIRCTFEDYCDQIKLLTKAEIEHIKLLLLASRVSRNVINSSLNRLNEYVGYSQASSPELVRKKNPAIRRILKSEF